jgi:hypothetical protein
MPKLAEIVLCLAVPGALAAQPLPEGWPLGARIPAISGRVVDAVTGKPIPNLDVTLRALSASGTFFGSGLGVLRYENARTSLQGAFAFPTSLEPAARHVLTTIGGYWLSVNQTFWSIAWMKAQAPNREHKIDTTFDDLSFAVTRDPLFLTTLTQDAELRMRGPRVNSKAYFPMAIQFKRSCRQQWNANCLSFDETEDLRVPLIPLLNGPAGCAPIQDSDLREQCRQLNTYANAVRRLDEAVCAQVDDGPGSRICIECLRGYKSQRGLR